MSAPTLIAKWSTWVRTCRADVYDTFFPAKGAIS